MPRRLLPREQGALDTLLSIEFPGVAELRRQAATVEADGAGLIVDEALPQAKVLGYAAVSAPVDVDEDFNGLILFVEAGQLSALEYWWTAADTPPREFPPVEAIGTPVAAAE